MTDYFRQRLFLRKWGIRGLWLCAAACVSPWVVHGDVFPEAVNGVVTLTVAEGTSVTYGSTLPVTVTRLRKIGKGEAVLTGSSSATAPVDIEEGTLTLKTQTGWGSAAENVGRVTVTDGATLHLYFVMESASVIGISRPVHISGAGVNGVGAIRYSRPAGTEGISKADAILKSIVLDADATISAATRWGTRGITYNGHTLTRIGADEFMLRSGTFGAGDFVNAEGYLTLQDTMFSGNGTDSSIRMAGGSLKTWGLRNTQPFTPRLICDSDSGNVIGTGEVTGSAVGINATGNRFTGGIELRQKPILTPKLMNIECPVTGDEINFCIGNSWGTASTVTRVNFREGATAATLRPVLYDLALMSIYGGALTNTMVRVGQDGRRAAIRQTGGYFSDGEGDTIYLGENAGSYGAYCLEGGQFDVHAKNTTVGCYLGKKKGSDVTRHAVGMFVQKGGLYAHTCQEDGYSYYPRISVGDAGYGYCVVSGGTNDTFVKKAQVWRTRLAGEGGRAVLDVSGTDTLYRTGFVIFGHETLGGEAFLSVRNGAQFSADRMRRNGGTAFCYFDGGILLPSYHSGFSAIDSNDSQFHAFDPDTWVIGPKGMVIDTSICYNNGTRTTKSVSVIPFSFSAPTGKGIASITLPDVAVAGKYIGPVPLYIESVTGHGATAYADFDFETETFTPVILSPGCGYDETTKIYLPSSSVLDGSSGRLECAYTLADNVTTGGLTKRGSEDLQLWGQNTYLGPMVVEEGVLLCRPGALPEGTDLTVRKNAQLLLRGGTPNAATIGKLSGRGTVEGNLTCTGGLAVAAAEAYGARESPLLVKGTLTFGADARVTVTDPGNLDDYQDGGKITLVRATGGITGRPELVMSDDFSGAWHLVWKADEIQLGYVLPTVIIIR